MNISYFKWTLKREWKGGLIYFAILTAWIMMVAAVFPSFQNSISNPFTEAGKIRIEEMDDGDYNLTWEELPGYDIHALVGTDEEPDLMDLMTRFNESGIDVDDIPVNITEIIQDEEALRQLLAPEGYNLIYLGGDHQAFIDRDGADRYFFVLYTNTDLDFFLSDLVDAENLTTESPFDAYMEDNAFIEGFVGDLDLLDFTNYSGFMVIEFLEMWALLIGIYAAIKGLSFVTRLIDDKSLDILLATGYTRERLILEKFLTAFIIILFLHVGSFLMLGLGGVALGEPVDWGAFAIVFLTSIPFALAALMIGVMISSFMEDYRSALWAVLGVILTQYMFMFIGNILESLEWMLYFTIFGYWDPTEIVFGSSFPYVDMIVLSVFSLVLFIAAIILFRKRDLPT